MNNHTAPQPFSAAPGIRDHVTGLASHSDAALITEANRRGLPIPDGFELAHAREVMARPGVFDKCHTVRGLADTALEFGLSVASFAQAWGEHRDALVASN